MNLWVAKSILVQAIKADLQDSIFTMMLKKMNCKTSKSRNVCRGEIPFSLCENSAARALWHQFPFWFWCVWSMKRYWSLIQCLLKTDRGSTCRGENGRGPWDLTGFLIRLFRYWIEGLVAVIKCCRCGRVPSRCAGSTACTPLGTVDFLGCPLAVMIWTTVNK